MPAKYPRVQVTLDKEELELVNILAEKKGKTVSAVVKKMVEEWLDHYEDMQFSILAMQAEEESKGKPTYSFEEVWKLVTE